MAEVSGAHWCARYPTSTAVTDLTDPFRANVSAFTAALRSASATVSIAATYRPKQRAYLMHWAWGIAKGLPANMCRPGDKPGVPIAPASVPPYPGIEIDWTHRGDLAKARAAAAEMVAGYGLRYCASLDGRHMQRRAVDMTIGWNGVLAIRDKAGTLVKIASQPRNGLNRELIALGKTFGVIKLISDPPHWSDDGR